MALDLSQVKKDPAEIEAENKGPFCHRVMSLVPLQGGVAGVTGALLTAPCQKEKCSLWRADKNKCREALIEGD